MEDCFDAIVVHRFGRMRRFTLESEGVAVCEVVAGADEVLSILSECGKRLVAQDTETVLWQSTSD